MHCDETNEPIELKVARSRLECIRFGSPYATCSSCNPVTVADCFTVVRICVRASVIVTVTPFSEEKNCYKEREIIHSDCAVVHAALPDWFALFRTSLLLHL